MAIPAADSDTLKDPKKKFVIFRQSSLEAGKQRVLNRLESGEMESMLQDMVLRNAKKAIAARMRGSLERQVLLNEGSEEDN